MGSSHLSPPTGTPSCTIRPHAYLAASDNTFKSNQSWAVNMTSVLGGHPTRRALASASAFFAVLGFLLPAVGFPGSDSNTRITLVYIWAPDCPACRQFDADVGGYYSQTDEGRDLPMTRINLSEWNSGRHPASRCATGPVMGTPTFIYLVGCEERDRIYGYSSDELFWLALKQMSNKEIERERSDAS